MWGGVRLGIFLACLALAAPRAQQPSNPPEYAPPSDWRRLPRPENPGGSPSPPGPLSPANQIQLEHIANEMCRQMEEWVGWVRGFNGAPCRQAQMAANTAHCNPDGSLIGKPSESCAASFAREAREWLEFMHEDLFGLRGPTPSFARVAPLSPTALNSRLAAQQNQRGGPAARNAS